MEQELIWADSVNSWISIISNLIIYNAADTTSDMIHDMIHTYSFLEDVTIFRAAFSSRADQGNKHFL